ncbi:MAG: alkaline shock response membrane anchor protein AmaP [Bradymonadales bacterium]
MKAAPYSFTNNQSIPEKDPMKALHKIIYSSLLLLCIAAIATFAATLLQVLAIDHDRLQQLDQFITTGPRWQITSLVILSMSMLIILFVLFWRVWRSAKLNYRVFGEKTKDAFVTRKSVESIAQSIVADYEGVIGNRCSSSPSRDGIKLNYKITVQQGVLIPELVNRVQEHAKHELESQLGVKIVNIVTNVHFRT